MNEQNEHVQNDAAEGHAAKSAKAEKRRWACPFSCDLRSMRTKIMLVIGAVALVFLFILLLGYRVIMEEARLAAEARLMEPKYKYEFSLDGGVIGRPSSAFVDLKLEGSDMPLDIEAPADIELSWTLGSEVRGKDCAVYGRDSDGSFFEFPIEDDGALLLSGVGFSDLREEGEIDIYSVGCLIEDSAGTTVEELDEVYVRLVTEKAASATSTESSVEDEEAADEE